MPSWAFKILLGIYLICIGPSPNSNNIYFGGEEKRDVATKISGYCIGDEVVRGQYINDIAYTHSYLLYKWATKWAANDDTNASKTISLI